MDQNRRDFVKKSCLLCASIIGVGTLLPALQSCAPLLTVKTDVKQGEIEVDKTLFNDESKIVIVKNSAQEFDIALVQLNENQFKAFELQCTHQSNPVIPTKTGFHCNAHGSSFSFDGQVKNPPAQKNLKEYKLEINNLKIIIIV